MRAGGHTLGERAHANRVRTNVLTLYLVIGTVVGGAALAVPFILLAALVEEKGLLAYAPVLLPAGALVGAAIAAYVLADERRRAAGLLRDPSLNAADQGSHLSVSLSQVSRAAGLEAPPPLYLQEVDDTNAYAIGHKPEDAYVVVTRGLIELLSPQELKGVLGHEVAHIKNEDVRLTGRADTLARVAGLLRRMLLAPTGVIGYGEAAVKLSPLAVVAVLTLLDVDLLKHVHTGTPIQLLPLLEVLVLSFGGLLLVVAYFFALAFAGRALLFVAFVLCTSVILPMGLLISNPFVAAGFAARVSRVREYQADADAVSYTGEPFALASALRKLAGIAPPRLISTLTGSRHALFAVADVRAGVWNIKAALFATHPPMQRRIEALDRLGGVDTRLAEKADQLRLTPQQEGSP